MRKNAKNQKLSLYKYLWFGTDSSTVHVFCEDSAGALCSLSALGFLTAAVKFSPVWDAYGSIGIGMMLMGVGSFLGFRNAQLLSGQSVPENGLEEVVRVLNQNHVVASYHDLKSMVVGVNACVIKVEVNFNADRIADRHINIDNIFPRFEQSLNNNNLSAFHDTMMRSCAEYQTWLTLERANLENEIRNKVREFGYRRVHVDIENY